MSRPNSRDGALQFLHALLVRRDLRLDVGDVHVGAARGIGRAGQQRAELGLPEAAAIDQQEVVDDDAFLLQRAATPAASSPASGRRYRRGGRGEPTKNRISRPRLVEDRRDDRDVGQVRAAIVGVVQRHDVAGLAASRRASGSPCARSRPSRRDAPAHAAHWPPARPVASKMAQEKSSRSLMFTRERGVLQHRAGLLGDVHEQVVEQLQHHRVGRATASAMRGRALLRCGAGPGGCSARDLGGPAGLDHGGGDGLADQGGAGDAVAGAQRLAVEDRGLRARRRSVKSGTVSMHGHRPRPPRAAAAPPPPPARRRR